MAFPTVSEMGADMSDEDKLVNLLLSRCAQDQWVGWSGGPMEHIKVLRFSDDDDLRVGRLVQAIAAQREAASKAAMG